MQLKNKLRAFWLGLFRRMFKKRFYDQVNEKLSKAVEDEAVEKIILKGRILKMCRKYLRADARSKHIPPTRRNHQEIRERIEVEFGERMRAHNVRLTDDLTLV